jgi:predicted Zn-dependent protease
MSWTATYFDGRTPERRHAAVVVSSTGLEITTSEGLVRRWRFADVRQTQGRHPGESVRLEHGGPAAEVLVVDDPAFTRAVRAAAPDAARHVRSARAWPVRLALTLGAAVAAAGLIVVIQQWGVPIVTGIVARLVPVGWETRLGDQIFAQIVEGEHLCEDPGRQNVIDGLVAALMAPQAPTAYRVRVSVVDRPEVNAFALPGGRIIVLRGLLEFADTPDMLAGVLAHEIQHVLRRHATRAILQHVSTGILVAAIAGDATGMVAIGLESARALGTLAYSRRAEEEADVEGMRMLLAARVDPGGMVRFFDRLARTTQEPVASSGPRRYLRTHPLGAERAARLRAVAAGAEPPTPLLPSVDWTDVKRICAA